MSVTRNWLHVSFGLFWRASLLLQVSGLLFSLLVGKFLLAGSFYLLLRPTVFYGTLALVVVLADLGFKLNPLRALFGRHFNLSEAQWRTCTFSLASLLITLAIVNAVVAFTTPFDVWLDYKLFGKPALFIAGMLATSWIVINKQRLG